MKRKRLEEAIACASYAVPNLSSRRACALFDLLCKEPVMKTFYLVLMALAACAQTEPVPVSAPVSVPTPVPVPVPAPDVPVVLSGDMESPPVQTAATGRALIIVNEDGTVSGVVEAPDIADATVVIEDDAADVAVPVVVTLVPVAHGRWEVPAGTLLTPAQIDHYKSGKLSANVRSKAHPKGEIRAPLQGNARAKASK
jgi:hypothetical protein